MNQQRSGENTPCAERTRAEFSPPLKPCDNVSLIKQSRNLVEKLILRNNVPVSQLTIIKDRFDFLVRILRSQEDILQDFRTPLIKLVMPLKKGGPDAAPGIPGRGLDENMLIAAFAFQSRYQQTVRRYSARKA